MHAKKLTVKNKAALFGMIVVIVVMFHLVQLRQWIRLEDLQQNRVLSEIVIGLTKLMGSVQMGLQMDFQMLMGPFSVVILKLNDQLDLIVRKHLFHLSIMIHMH